MSGSGAVIGVGGHAAGRALMSRAASSIVASVRSGMTWPVPQVGADGSGVVMGCDEPLAARWWGSGEVWPGLVWCKSGLPAGISRCAGLLWVAWRAATLYGVVTSGTKHDGTEGDTLRRFLQVSEMGGTSWDG